MAGDIFSNYAYGSQSPASHAISMNFCGPQTVGGFGQSHNLDSLYGTTPTLDAGVDLVGEQDYRLFMEQQPAVGLATDKEKDRKPIDPPPVVRIEVSARKDPRGVYLSNPYCFMLCRLKKITKDDSGNTKEEYLDGSKLSGSIVSSLHRLRNTENRDVGYFVFGDMYPRDAGEYRLIFTLYEMGREGTATFVELASIESASFAVWPSKSFPGMKQSTYLTRAISDQGVRVRLRKDSRQSLSSRRKRHMSLTGLDDGGPAWQQQRQQHVSTSRVVASPAHSRTAELPPSSSRTSHSVSPTQSSQQRQSSIGGYSMTGHVPSPISTSLYGDSLAGSLANSAPARDREARLNNMGLRLPQPQVQGQFLTTPPPTARMGNPSFYNFSSGAAMGQNTCYSSADAGPMLPLHQQQHQHPPSSG